MAFDKAASLQADKDLFQSAAVQYGPKDAPEDKAQGENFSKANQQIAMALYNKEGGKNLPSYISANKQVTERMNENLGKVKKDYARQQFEAQYGSATDSTIDQWMKGNQVKLEKDLYGMLTKQAVESGVEFDKGDTYQKYLAGNIKKETPIDTSSYWDKTVNVAKNIGYGMTDTIMGVSYAVKDEFTGGNDYKDYLGDRAASISQGDDSFWKKMGSTFGEQGGWVDVAFAVGSAVSGGALAAPLASMKVAMGFGKGVGKMALKGAGKELFEQGIEAAFKNTSKELTEGLLKGNIDDLAKLAAREGMDSSTYLAKLGRTLNATNKEHNIFTAGSKAEKDFYKHTDAFTNLMGQKLNKTTGLGALDFAGDMFGLPTQMIKFGDGKGLRMSVGGSLMTVGLPATSLLPGVGDAFEKVILQTGTWTSGLIAKSTKSGLYEKERSAFEDKYGINPDEASPELKSQWDKLIQYKLRYATPSENLTGIAVKDRSGFGQFLYGAGDTAANFIGVFAGIKAVTKGYDVAKENMAPYSYNAEGKLVSNIDFLQKLDEIHNDDRLDDTQKESAIEDLKAQIKAGDPSLQKTIMSVKELKFANAHMMDYMEKIGGNEFGKQIDGQFMNEQYEGAKLILEGKHEEGIQRMSEAQGRLDETLSKYTSGEGVKKLKDKMDLLDTYLQKVRNSTGIMSSFQKSFVSNAFLSHELDPTMASIRGNDSLVAQVFSTFSQVQNAHEIIGDVLKSEGRYIQDTKNISGDFTELKKRSAKILETSGIPVTEDAVNRLTMLVATPLAQVRLTVKGFGDKNLSKIFDEVFTEHGIDFAQKKEGDKSLGEILSEIGNPDQQFKDSLTSGFSDQLIEQMDSRIQTEQIKIAEYSDFVKANAFRMSQLMEFFGDLTSNVHIQRNTERIIDMNLTKTEEITKEELIDTLDHEIKQRSEEGLVIDDLVSQRESAKKLPDDATVLAEKDNKVEIDPRSAATVKIMSGEDVATKLADESQDILKSQQEDFQTRQENLDRFAMFYIHGRAATESYYRNLSHDQNTETVKAIDELESKENDNSRDNDMRIRNFDDDTKKNIQSIFDEFGKDTENFTLEGLKDLSNRESAEHRKEYYSTRNSLINNSELTSGERKALSDKMQELSKKAVNEFTRDKIIELAKQSESVEDFQSKLESSLVEHFGFNEKGIEKFMDKQFPKSKDGNRNNSLIPFWELKRKQEKIRAVNIQISDKGTTIHDSNNPEATYDGKNKYFTDRYGNPTTYRIKGIGVGELEKTHDVIHIDDVTIDGSNMNDIWRSKDGNRMEKFNEYSTKMEEAMSKHDGGGWIYLGDFSEMGNKKIFVRSKGGETTWTDAMSRLTGIDVENQIKNQPNFDARNQIIGNLAKYAKLIWWGEITPNQASWDTVVKQGNASEISLNGIDELDAYIKENPRSNKVRTLFFDDLSKDLDTKLFDGRDFVAQHLAAVLNRSAGNHPTNSLFKTATNMGQGQFIKSKSESFDDAGAILTDKYIMGGIMKAAETDPILGAVMDLMQRNYGDWAGNPEARSMFMQLNDTYKMIDRIVPMSAYKNIFTRKTGGLGIQGDFESYKSGDIAEHDLSSMGLKAIDESNKRRSTEKVKVSTQLNRSIVPMEGFSQKEANAINDVFTEVKKDDFLRVSELMKSLGVDPVGTINVIEKEFGVSFKDYRNRDFLTDQGKKNIEKMLTNIMKKNITTGANLEGNYIDLTYIPQYENIRDHINESMKDGQEDNWVILSKEYYKHLYERNVDRFMMFRYPVVGPKIITAPKIIWKEDLEASFGKLDIGDSIVPNHKLIEQIEGDGDGDKVMLLTDKRLEKVQKEIEKFVDIKKPAYNVDNSKANNHKYTDNLEDLWHQTNFDTFEGKANIGTIDNQLSRVEQLISMGLIDNTPAIKDRIDPYSDSQEKYFVINPDGTKNYKVSDADYLRGVLGKTLQRAVDNKIIDIKAIKDLINGNLKGKKMPLSSLQEGVFRKDFKTLDDKIFKNMGYVEFNFGDKYNIKLADIKYFNEIPGWEAFVTKMNTKAHQMVVKNPYDGENRKLIVELNDAEKAEFRKFTLNTVMGDIGRVNDVFGKTFFFDAETKEKMRSSGMSEFDIDDAEKKSLRELKKEYDKAYPLYEAMVEKYGKEKVNSFGMMRTFGDAKGYFDREIYDYSNELNATVNEALEKTKSVFGEKPSVEAAVDLKNIISAYTILSRITVNNYKNIDENIKSILLKTDKHIFEKMGEVFGKGQEIEFKEYKTTLLAALENVVFRTIDKHNIKDADGTIFHFIKDADSPLFDLLTSEGRTKINESMVENLNRITMDRIGQNVDLTEFHNAESYEAKMKAYDKAFQDKAKEMNISDTEIQALNKNTRVVYKEYARRGGDIQRVLEHHDRINSYDPDNAEIVNSHITSLSREEIKMVGEILGNPKELDMMKTENEARIETTGNVIKESYTDVKDNSNPNNC